MFAGPHVELILLARLPRSGTALVEPPSESGQRDVEKCKAPGMGRRVGVCGVVVLNIADADGRDGLLDRGLLKVDTKVLRLSEDKGGARVSSPRDSGRVENLAKEEAQIHFLHFVEDGEFGAEVDHVGLGGIKEDGDAESLSRLAVGGDELAINGVEDRERFLVHGAWARMRL